VGEFSSLRFFAIGALGGGSVRLGQMSKLENECSGVHIRGMNRWLKIALIISGLFAGWVALSVLTFDDSVRVDHGQ
jgi:hypothetical protein